MKELAAQDQRSGFVYTQLYQIDDYSFDLKDKLDKEYKTTPGQSDGSGYF
jgi:hypothetical protein